MSLVAWFVRNPVKVAVGVILIVMFGLISLWTMPMQLTPEVETPTITIETRWPGASPEDIEKTIVQEQEEQLKSVEGVTKMESESSDSNGKITLEFAAGTDLREAVVKIKSRLDQVRDYPINADRPIISTTNLADQPIAWFVLTERPPSPEELTAFVAKYPKLETVLAPTREAKNAGLVLYRLRRAAAEHPEFPELAEINPPLRDLPKLRRLMEDEVESALERVEGVAAANIIGGQRQEMQVVVDPQKLAVRQLTLGDVRDALRRESEDTSGGEYDEGKRRWVVRTMSQYRTPEKVANVIVARRDNASVYVRDVAEVHIGYKKPEGLTRRFGRGSLAINCQKRIGANSMAVMAELRAANERLNKQLLEPRGLRLEQVYDETEYIQDAVDVVKENIIEGSILTFITLLLFLRSASSTLVIGLHIAISTIGAFLAMAALGRSLNVLCLGGLAFAVGMLVDNAIVMLENIYRRNENGESPLTASVRGSSEVFGALLNASAVNLAVFLPVLFIKQEAGQLFRDVAIAISASVGLSMLVAVTVVPTMATRLLQRRDRKHARNGRGDISEIFNRRSTHGSQNGRLAGLKSKGHAAWTRVRDLLGEYALKPLDRFAERFVDMIVNINLGLQRGLILRVAVVVCFVVAASGLTWVLMPKVEYMPNGNQNLVIAFMLPPPGYNLDYLTEIGSRIEERLRPYWDVAAGSPKAKELDYPPIGDYFYVIRGKSLFLGVRSQEPERAHKLVELLAKATSDLPGMLVSPSQRGLFERGLSSGRTIDIEIVGHDVRQLVGLGQRVFGQLSGPESVIPGARVLPRPSLDVANPEMHVLPKGEQAAEMQVSQKELGFMVDALVDGAYVGDYIHDGKKIDLMIRGDDKFASRTEDLLTLPIATPTGQVVQLAALADIKMSSGPEQINRRERIRAITIQVRPPEEMPLEDAMERIENQIIAPLASDPLIMSGNYQVMLSGTSDKLRDTWKALRFNLILAVILTYLLMAAMFESWLYPFVVILSVPLGAVGGFAGLQLLNMFVERPQPLDVLTMLGFVILVGTVVNNPILLVEQALVHMREDRMNQKRAIIESVRNRIRPIFMTTIAGLIGLLPLVVSPGTGSELYRGIGAVLLGGMIVSTALTLVFVPTLFSLTLDMRDYFARRYGWWRTTDESLEHALEAEEIEAPREPAPVG